MSGVVMNSGQSIIAVADCLIDHARIQPSNLNIIHVQHKTPRWCDTPVLRHSIANVCLGLVRCVAASIGILVNQKDKRKRTIIKSEIGPLR
jgi:hypothetical protein